MAGSEFPFEDGYVITAEGQNNAHQYVRDEIAKRQYWNKIWEYELPSALSGSSSYNITSGVPARPTLTATKTYSVRIIMNETLGRSLSGFTIFGSIGDIKNYAHSTTSISPNYIFSGQLRMLHQTHFANDRWFLVLNNPFLFVDTFMRDENNEINLAFNDTAYVDILKIELYELVI